MWVLRLSENDMYEAIRVIPGMSKIADKLHVPRARFPFSGTVMAEASVNPAPILELILPKRHRDVFAILTPPGPTPSRIARNHPEMCEAI